MNFFENNNILSRRSFLKQSGMGLGAAGLASLMSPNAHAGQKGLHHKAKAKRVIFLFMAGGQSQLDLFDHKPGLNKLFNTKLPASVSNGQRVTQMTKGKEQLIQPSKFKFSQHGQSGTWMSELMPHLANSVDDLCMIKSMHTKSINHDPGKTMFCTGSELPGKPSMGSWLSYGMGSMNKDLPEFVVMPSAFWSGGTGNVQALYSRLWGNGFLPSKHQGTALQAAGDPVLFLSNPPGVTAGIRRSSLDAVGQLNNGQFAAIGDPEIQATVAQQELAYRMQSSVPELTDLSHESKATLEMYGPEVHKQGSFARNCLLARRMAERDVRFIQLFHRGWDHHSGLPGKIKGQCYDVDQPAAALIKDLKQRGMLEDTLIVCAGEFGRTVYGQGKLNRDNYGRDHHPRCFSAWMAGGGVKAGISYGQTDEFSYNVVDKPVSVSDLHATMLWQLGLDHSRLSFPFQGLDQKLTGVDPCKVVQGLIS
ncbi:DUF1501 domain-containing protein [Lentisphaera profundi]|uniref:DUF1501 domain-containing protein n=1 Tax=Lentisphaera profundi TaxID=1658616 RepID=A0ABY7VUC9_9BACT|nr:DUF1501 domain-containing protein [Lentisphaera profundi]WDE97327.1 DUF1501 domain-containing protein [Lentisphaera profundi]